MSVKYTFLSENENMQGTKLQICSDEKRSVSVLQYKAQAVYCILMKEECILRIKKDKLNKYMNFSK